MKVKNISVKPMSIGPLDLLPGDVRDIPAGWENNPSLELYQSLGIIKTVAEADPAEVAHIDEAAVEPAAPDVKSKSRKKANAADSEEGSAE